MDDTNDTPAELPVILSNSMVGKSHQLSEQAAALLSSMKIETQSSEISETILILLLQLQNITARTTSSDKLWLSTDDTARQCLNLGIDGEKIIEVLNRFNTFSNNIRKNNPFSF